MKSILKSSAAHRAAHETSGSNLSSALCRGYKPRASRAAIIGAATLCALPAAAAAKAPKASPAKAERPNIIFFLIDDMGWCDSEVAYGDSLYPVNRRFHTPNMKKLSEKGVIFTSAYAAPVSTPTRTSLMTGLNAAHLGVTNWTALEKNSPTDASGAYDKIANDSLVPPKWNHNGISPTAPLENGYTATPMVQLLKDAGYYTIHVGKGHWSTAGSPGANPYNFGFCVNVAGSVAGMPNSYYGEQNYGNTVGKWSPQATMNMAEYYGTPTHLTEALTLEALKTLDYPVKNGIPFYLYMSHHGVHTPITPDKRFVDRYLSEGLDKGQSNYASLVEGVDKSLGDIMKYLDDNKIADNTIIIFYADNGGNSENKKKGGVLHTQNLPLREGKGSCYEGGIRVPMMAYWPGVNKPGKRIDTPVICDDFFPTILSMGGVRNYTTTQTLDGMDITPLITGKGKAPAADRELVFHYPHQWKPYRLDDIDYLTSMRKGDWKIVYRQRTGALELYNLKQDIGERNNLAAANPAKLREMATLLSRKLRTWQAPMPTLRATGQTIPYPDELLP